MNAIENVWLNFAVEFVVNEIPGADKIKRRNNLVNLILFIHQFYSRVYEFWLFCRSDKIIFANSAQADGIDFGRRCNGMKTIRLMNLLHLQNNTNV